MGCSYQIKRRDNWPILLAQFLRERKDCPFVWGANDCTLFTAAAIEAITGLDPAADWRGQYESREGAYKVLEQFGGLEAAVTHVIGILPETNIRLASRGDIVMIEEDGALAIGIVDESGRRIAVMTMTGIARVSLKRALCAWRY